MKKISGKIIYSPSDLIRYLASPYSSWMDRYHLENPGAITPDEPSEDQKLIAQTGDQHEQTVLEEYKASTKGLVEISRHDSDALKNTLSAIGARTPIVYQGSLESDRFAGFTDFIVLDGVGQYQIWDTKLARAPKPYYAIQLCCYSEMFAATTGEAMPKKFGIILGSKDKVEFHVEDFIHYYRRIRDSFLVMQDGFTGKLEDCPEPLPSADHGRWTSHADKFFDETDHLVRVAGITAGQIKKLKAAGISTMTQLAAAKGKAVPKLAAETLEKLIAQARLQCETLANRLKDPTARAQFEVLPQGGVYEPTGLAALPREHPADIYFDMEGYPLMSGGLEYLFGTCIWNQESKRLEFKDWWAHDRSEEKAAFEGFVDWIFKRWRDNPGMHIYHYAAYEVSAIRRLSTRHDTRQDEVDELLRHEVFVDLYQVVRHGLRIGEDSYSIKKVEDLYRDKRETAITTAADSIVQYARWIESKQPRAWKESPILKDIRDYNEDDCKSTAELLQWLRGLAASKGIKPSTSSKASASAAPFEEMELSPEIKVRLETIAKLRKQRDPLSLTLADLVDFHRREEKPMWWRLFDRAEADPETLRDDAGCIQGVQAVGASRVEKQSKVQAYRFDPSQECKLAGDGKTMVMFTHNTKASLTLVSLDIAAGTLELKAGSKTLEKLGGEFPAHGSLIPNEYVPATSIQLALTAVASKHLAGDLHKPVAAILERKSPSAIPQTAGESTTDAGIRVANKMAGDCLVIQGPPGTGKTYTAAHLINALLSAGKKVGVASNSHKAIVNLLVECGETARSSGKELHGIKVGGAAEGALYADNPGVRYIETNKDAHPAYTHGVAGGTAWLFTLPEWEGALDYLFIDESGQVSLANAIAMSRSASNLVLLGDQMQLEQPIQGTHPGDAGLSSLQYALKDLQASQTDLPVFHAVVPSEYGLFLGESRRMHPSVCAFISESMYEGRLKSFADCAHQRIALPAGAAGLVTKESGIIFCGVDHDGNIQQSDEEVARVVEIYNQLLGRPYTASDGKTRPLSLEDFLFIAPYNAQVRALQAALPNGARVGSVDKFQGQQAPVCILSLCSSYGEYGSRGLSFILDRNRINVAISRAQCMAIVVADPRIASTPAANLGEMSLINLFCKLLIA